MEKKEIIEKTKDYVKKALANDSSGHDWWHIERVWKNARFIGEKEDADLFVVELGALLHDIADWKFHGGTTKKGAEVTEQWLNSLHVEKSIVKHVSHIVENVSYKGAGVKNSIQTLEGKVVQDADRLDALGAIGIARVFAYGGHAGVEIHNPHEKAVLHKTFEEYKNTKGTSITHFYEKLLLLKDRMNTKTGRELAEKRHEFMELYLKQFYNEWNGSK